MNLLAFHLENLPNKNKTLSLRIWLKYMYVWIQYNFLTSEFSMNLSI